MKFTGKDLLIFIVLMGIVYFVMYGDYFQNSLGNDMNKVITPPKIERPSVDDVPVYSNKYKNFDNERYVTVGGNTMLRSRAEKVIRVADYDTLHVQKQQRAEELRRLNAALATGKIDRGEYERSRAAFKKSKDIITPRYREISLGDYTRELMEKRIGEIRYGEYIKECVKEKLKRCPQGLNSKVIVKVKHNGDLLETQVISSNSATSNNNFGINKVDKLLAALEKAAPFQPFPVAVKVHNLSYVLTLENGDLTVSRHYGTIRPDSSYSPSKKPRNKKRVEDTKIIECNVLAIGKDENGKILYASPILKRNQIHWNPVTVQNNYVTIDLTYQNGKLVNPIFMRKSDIREANEAALDAMYSLLLPDLSRFEQYPIIEIQGTFSVK